MGVDGKWMGQTRPSSCLVSAERLRGARAIHGTGHAMGIFGTDDNLGILILLLTS